jgi:hypothetical protein
LLPQTSADLQGETFYGVSGEVFSAMCMEEQILCRALGQASAHVLDEYALTGPKLTTTRFPKNIVVNALARTALLAPASKALNSLRALP